MGKARDLANLIADGKISVSEISATGTPGSGNFLRGDGSWAAAGASTDFGGIGSYTVAGSTSFASNTSFAQGTTYAGSTLIRHADNGSGVTQSLSGTSVGLGPTVNTAITPVNYGLSGTWRLMNWVRGQDGTLTPIGLFVRIS